MQICLTNRFLGTSANLIWSPTDDTYVWSNRIPQECWVFFDSDAVRDIGAILKAVDVEVSTFHETPWGRSLSVLGVNDDDVIPWPRVVPTSVFKDRLQKTLGQLWMTLRQESDGYYMNEFITNREVLTGLVPALIDVNKFDEYTVEASDGKGLSELLSFSPDSDGMCEKVVYDQSSSSTGRLTVRSGPKILTLRKRFRDILKSRYENGSIFQIDLISLEPRIALRVGGKSDTQDIYSQVSNEIFGGEISREKAKIATISCLYGMSSISLKDHFPERSTSDILSKIKTFFGIKSLKGDLKRQMNSLGHIKNFYGRRIESSGALINHYVQSTGVDVSLQCFNDLIKRFNDSGITADPLFVVHDALIVDLKSGKIEDIIGIIGTGLNSPGFDRNFPARVEEICR